MTIETPDYSKYNLEQLEDILVHINHEKYPDRVQLIRDILDDPVKFPKMKLEQEKLDKIRSEESLRDWALFSMFLVPEIMIPKYLLIIVVLGIFVSNKLFGFPSDYFRFWLVGLSFLVIFVIYIIDPNEKPRKDENKHIK